MDSTWVRVLQVGQIAIDAMGTRRAIAGKIVEKGGDCILSVKGNQAPMMIHLI